MKPHKWAKEIKAWADGAEIQFKDSHDINEWLDTDEPLWELDDCVEYRIKPQPKEPQYLYAFSDSYGNSIVRVHNGMNKNEIYLGKIKLEDE